MSINKAILIGNLGSDPEVRYLDGDRMVANFSLATNETYTDKSGNKITQTEWHRIEMWDGLAKVAEKYLHKGKQVYIEGKIKTENWKDKEGIERYTTKIRANTLQMLGNIESGSNRSETGRQDQDSSEMPPVEPPDGFDDLPF
ncbi:MAG: single-stranded DNA-binding protein [Bacteroidetes bacterium]|nr:single-stranded DNA-binding protein [Bacteroidota bacterium]